MLALAAALLAFSLPLDPWRAQPCPPPRPKELIQRPARRRAPLAEHGWEQRVLCNLTRSE